jgi:hypothetical protein
MKGNVLVQMPRKCVSRPTKQYKSMIDATNETDKLASEAIFATPSTPAL